MWAVVCGKSPALVRWSSFLTRAVVFFSYSFSLALSYSRAVVISGLLESVRRRAVYWARRYSFSEDDPQNLVP